MLVYRLTGSRYAEDLSGMGAAIFGGRWNKKGVPVLYTSESIALALLEVVVNTPPLLLPDLKLITLEISGGNIKDLPLASLPYNWYKYPAPSVLAEIADKFLQEESAMALKVPSCVVHQGYNYILNCRHKLFSKKVKLIKKEVFYFDPRLG